MSFHQYRIDELYSNASGTVQFIELSVDYYDGELNWPPKNGRHEVCKFDFLEGI